MADEQPPQEGYFRLRTPRDKEILGLVTGRVGCARFMVYCVDKKERMCRVPGKIKHRVWVKENDVVIIEPWPVEGDKKGDIVWRYTRIQNQVLKRQGLLKDLPL